MNFPAKYSPWIFFLLFGWLCYSNVAVASWDNSYTVTNSVYSIYWNISTDIISMRVEISSDGWCGIGFGNYKNKAHNNTDFIILTQLNDSSLSVGDYWSDSTTNIVEDQDQSIGIIDFAQSTNSSYFEFTRSLDTGDLEDIVIGNYLMSIYWAWGPTKEMQIHDSTSYRGTFNINLLGYVINPPVPLPDFPSSYSKNQTLRANLVTLYWTTFPYAIAMKLVSKNLGWIGIGFHSSDFGMTNCDMIIGSIWNGIIYIDDFWSEQFGQQPTADLLTGGTSNLKSRGGVENDTLWIEFVRPLYSNDIYDNSISPYSMNRLVWALGKDQIEKFSYHGSYRGTSWLNLFASPTGCINNCSGRGICVNSVCKCNTGFIGSDCSAVQPILSLYPAVYENSFDFNDLVSLRWKHMVINHTDYVSFKLSVSVVGTGWIALGINPTDVGMLNLDVVGTSTSGSVLIPEDYYSHDYTSPVRDSYLGGTNNIIAQAGQTDGTVWLELLRPVVAIEKYDNSLIRNSLNRLVWAYGTQARMSLHLSNCRGSAFVDLFSTGACPNKCSNRGYCDAGICLCQPGWIGEDCSYVLSETTSDYFPSKYHYTVPLSSYLSLSWEFLTINGVQSISLLLNSTALPPLSGWIGIGFEPQDEGMLNTDMVIGSVVGNVILVDDYYSYSRAKPVLDVTLGGTSNLISRGGLIDGLSWIEFIRPLKSNDAYDNSLNDTQSARLVWAVGVTKDLSKHLIDQRGFTTVDLFNIGSCDENCNGHGVCNNTVCLCDENWGGSTCKIPQFVVFPDQLDFTSVLASTVTISWSILNDSVAIELKRTGRGWIGLSLGGVSGMTEADMIVSTISDGLVVVQDYWSYTTTTPVRDISMQGQDDILYYSGIVDGDGVKVRFVRKLLSYDIYDRNITAGFMNAAYALGSTDSLSKHTSSNTYTFQIDFISGRTAGTLSDGEILRYTHGSLMFASWGVIFLGGMMWARYFRMSEEKVNGVPQWFYVHRLTQYIAYFLCLVGLAIALIMVKSHFETKIHAQLGISIVLMATIQVVYAFFRPQVPGGQKSKSRHFWENFHRVWGYLTLILSIAVIVSGLLEFGASNVYLIVYGIYIVVIIILAILGSWFKNRLDNRKEEEDALQMDMFDNATKAVNTIKFAQNEIAPPTTLRKQPPPQTSYSPLSPSQGNLVNETTGTLEPPPTSPYSRSGTLPRTRSRTGSGLSVPRMSSLDLNEEQPSIDSSSSKVDVNL